MAGALSAVPAQAAKPASDAGQRVDVHTGELAADQLSKLRELGVDDHSLVAQQARGGKVRVEVTLTGVQARGLARQGVTLKPKEIDGITVAERASLLQESVFRPYSGPGGIGEELEQVAAAHPNIARLVEIGRTVNNRPILAVRVSQGVAKLKDRKRPAVVYQAAQHAREWITPEMVRRPIASSCSTGRSRT